MECFDQVTRWTTRIGKAAGIIVNEEYGTYACPQSIRGGFAQSMVDEGADSWELQGLMRHASVTTAERNYLKADAVKQTRKLRQKLDPQGSPPTSGPSPTMYLGTEAVLPSDEIDVSPMGLRGPELPPKTRGKRDQAEKCGKIVATPCIETPEIDPLTAWLDGCPILLDDAQRDAIRTLVDGGAG